MKKTFIKRLLSLLTLIILYYIVMPKSIFLYVISYALYNIYISCYTHIDIKDSLEKYSENYHKWSILKYLILIYCVITLVFILISILVSDIISTIMDINNLTFVFIMMSIATITKPVVKLLSDYLISLTKNKKYLLINDIYFVADNLLLLIISLITFKLVNVKIELATSLLYLSKIVAMIIAILPVILINKKRLFIKKSGAKEKVNYSKEIKKILTNNSYKSTINIVKNSYYYISIMIVYFILSTRYHYQLEAIERDITFIYFYGLAIMNFLIYLAKLIDSEIPETSTLTNRLYNNFKIMLTIAIILSIVAPLTCKIIFNNPTYAIYQTMINFLAIFMLLYEITYENMQNKKLIYLGLIISLVVKLILVIPLINAFYRMGYNLIHGDIISTIIAVSSPVIINYVYIKINNRIKEKYFEKLLNILYENIILCIILILVEFIVPIDTNSYIKSIGILIIYLIISFMYLIIKNKKRG